MLPDKSLAYSWKGSAAVELSADLVASSFKYPGSATLLTVKVKLVPWFKIFKSSLMELSHALNETLNLPFEILNINGTLLFASQCCAKTSPCTLVTITSAEDHRKEPK